ncbi:hypothetical protein [Trichocoleus sp. FACHB-262]|uniref:hypothetical protein n=1 Tax=Trichocoleus sp. FACHB-262 TaxID=2692869 RepID=UPI001683566F|nr:hypothetical protein [Trichocoleus sp. FACHB-262]MBD2120191.1 hypothetical protein [Trichocoleus sp. FACHB-262]
MDENLPLYRYFKVWFAIKKISVRLNLLKKKFYQQELQLKFTDSAAEALEELRRTPLKLERVRKILGYLELRRKDASFKTQEFDRPGPNGEQMFVSCSTDNPAAFQIYWFIGDNPNMLVVTCIFIKKKLIDE